MRRAVVSLRRRSASISDRGTVLSRQLPPALPRGPAALSGSCDVCRFSADLSGEQVRDLQADMFMRRRRSRQLVRILSR